MTERTHNSNSSTILFIELESSWSSVFLNSFPPLKHINLWNRPFCHIVYLSHSPTRRMSIPANKKKKYEIRGECDRDPIWISYGQGESFFFPYLVTFWNTGVHCRKMHQYVKMISSHSQLLFSFNRDSKTNIFFYCQRTLNRRRRKKRKFL